MSVSEAPNATILAHPSTGAKQPVIAIRTYPTTLDAHLARIALEAAGVPAVVVGIGAGMEGGPSGVRLLVPEDRVEEALKVLGDD